MVRANEWGFWRITTRELKSFVHIFHDIMFSFHTYWYFFTFQFKGWMRTTAKIHRSFNRRHCDSTSQWKSQYVWNKKILRAILDSWDPCGLCTQPRLTWFFSRNISNMRLPFNFWLPYRSKTIVIWHIRNEKGCRDLPSKRYWLRRSRASSGGW